MVIWRKVLLIAAPAAVLIGLLWPDSSGVDSLEVSSARVYTESDERAEAALPAEILSPKNVMGDTEAQPDEEMRPHAAEHVPHGSPISPDETPDHFTHLIPDWLLDSGDVRRERVEIAGHSVERVRSRYEWPNGSQVEVEVSDLGSNASEDLFQSLGFDFEIEADEAGEKMRWTEDAADYMCNLEYDPDDAVGFVQYIISGRYLLEVKLQNLPLESFQTLEHRDRLLDRLLEYVSE